MSRHVPHGVAWTRERDRTHTLGVSCPVPLSRPSVQVALAIGTPLHGKPNELDAVHLPAGYHATRNCFLYRATESLASCIGFLLFGAVGGVLSVEFGTHQLDVTGAYRRTIREWPEHLPTIGKDGHEDAP